MSAFRCALVVPLVCWGVLLAAPERAAEPMKHPAEEKGIKSINADVETTIKFVNKSKETIKVYWLDYEGDRQLYETVKDGDSYELGKTYLTHPWLITDEKDNAWYIYFPDAQPRTIEVFAPKKV